MNELVKGLKRTTNSIVTAINSIIHIKLTFITFERFLAVIPDFVPKIHNTAVIDKLIRNTFKIRNAVARITG